MNPHAEIITQFCEAAAHAWADGRDHDAERLFHTALKVAFPLTGTDQHTNAYEQGTAR